MLGIDINELEFILESLKEKELVTKERILEIKNKPSL
jgi:hypothetical protein